MTLSKSQRETAVEHLLKNASLEMLELAYQQRERPNWWIAHHFGLGLWVRNTLREGGFTGDDQTLDKEWPALIVEAAEQFARGHGL